MAVAFAVFFAIVVTRWCLRRSRGGATWPASEAKKCNRLKSKLVKTDPNLANNNDPDLCLSPERVSPADPTSGDAAKGAPDNAQLSQTGMSREEFRRWMAQDQETKEDAAVRLSSVVMRNGPRRAPRVAPKPQAQLGWESASAFQFCASASPCGNTSHAVSRAQLGGDSSEGASAANPRMKASLSLASMPPGRNTNTAASTEPAAPGSARPGRCRRTRDRRPEDEMFSRRAR